MKEGPFTNMCMEKLLSSAPKITVGLMKLCPKRKKRQIFPKCLHWSDDG